MPGVQDSRSHSQLPASASLEYGPLTTLCSGATEISLCTSLGGEELTDHTQLPSFFSTPPTPPPPRPTGSHPLAMWPFSASVRPPSSTNANSFPRGNSCTTSILCGFPCPVPQDENKRTLEMGVIKT